MKTTLTIDTSSTLCSIGLFHNNQLFEKKQAGFKSHASVILSFIDELLIQSKISLANVDRIVFVKGPGSFTGLRISACVAQGLAIAHDIPVVGVSSLQAIAQGVWRVSNQSRVWVITDARMAEVYHAPYVEKNGIMEAHDIERVGPLSDIQLNNAFYYYGSGLIDVELLKKQGLSIDGYMFNVSYIDCEDLITIADTLISTQAALALPSYIRKSVAKKREEKNG